MATIVDLLTGIQQALTADNFFTTTTCTYAFDPPLVAARPPSDQFVVIQPNRLVVKEQTWSPGPSRNYVYAWHATLWLFVRLNVDEAGREDSYLLDTTLGSVVLVDGIVDVLQNYVNRLGFGYTLDDVQWPDESHNTVGWAVTRLLIHTDLTGRSSAGD